MKLVIEISEDIFFDLKKKQNRTEVDNAILNGIPLPKGHGRIVDESKITKCEKVGIIIKDGSVIPCITTNAPTLIERSR